MVAEYDLKPKDRIFQSFWELNSSFLAKESTSSMGRWEVCVYKVNFPILILHCDGKFGEMCKHIP